MSYEVSQSTSELSVQEERTKFTAEKNARNILPASSGRPIRAVIPHQDNKFQTAEDEIPSYLNWLIVN